MADALSGKRVGRALQQASTESESESDKQTSGNRRESQQAEAPDEEDGPGGQAVTIQKIIESLLRARLYRRDVVLRLRSGETHRLRVNDVRYDGSASSVLVSRAGNPRRTFEIPLRDVEAARCGDYGPDAA